MTRTAGIPWLRIGAESIAIIASILLAFAIDAWYEGISNSRLEIEYKQRLKDELNAARSLLVEEAEAFRWRSGHAQYAAAFFEGSDQAINSDQLIAALFYLGLDPVWSFELSTFNDLVSTGRLNLISDTELRAAIQSAYRDLERVEFYIAPYREAYLSNIRGWVPQSVVELLFDACPGPRPAAGNCSPVNLDGALAEEFLRRISTDEALIAFRLRRQGVATATAITAAAIETTESALELLD